MIFLTIFADWDRPFDLLNVTVVITDAFDEIHVAFPSGHIYRPKEMFSHVKLLSTSQYYLSEVRLEPPAIELEVQCLTKSTRSAWYSMSEVRLEPPAIVLEM